MSYQIVSILDSILGQGRAFSKGEYYYYCPFCSHYNAKFAVNINKRKWHCWKCGARGKTLLSLLTRLNVSKSQIAELKDLLGDELPKFQTDTDSEAILTLPDEYLPLYEPVKDIDGRHALSYLHKRGFTDIDILKYRIGYCKYGKFKNRIIVPSFDETGKLNYFVGRDFFEVSSLNYLTPSISKNLVGFEFYINWDLPIVLVEGAFDAMAVKRNSIPLFGKNLPKKLREKIIQHNTSEIYLVLDDDALKETLRMAEHFMKQGIKVYVVELSGKDPAELGFSTTMELIKRASPLTFSSLMQLKLRLV